jgi:hypothetical protein
MMTGQSRISDPVMAARRPSGHASTRLGTMDSVSSDLGPSPSHSYPATEAELRAHCRMSLRRTLETLALVMAAILAVVVLSMWR